MDVDVTQRGGVTIVRLAGDPSVDVFKKTLQSLLLDEKYDLILDLSSLASLDSLGVGLIIAHYVSASAHGGRVLLLGANQKIRTLMENVQLDHRFGWASSLESALDYFDPSKTMPPI